MCTKATGRAVGALYNLNSRKAACTYSQAVGTKYVQGSDRGFKSFEDKSVQIKTSTDEGDAEFAIEFYIYIFQG